MAYQLTINTEDAGPSENMRVNPQGDEKRRTRSRTAFGAEHVTLENAYIKINRIEVAYAPVLLKRFQQDTPVLLVTLGVYASAEARTAEPKPTDVLTVAIPDVNLSTLFANGDPRPQLYIALPAYDARLTGAMEI